MDSEDTSSGNNSFRQIIKSPWRFKFFLAKKLPMAFLAGLKIKQFTPEGASVTIRLNKLTKNPFRSIYFACLAMAAELSTGILAMNGVESSGHRFSFLVVNLEASFLKKATGTVTFTCPDGTAIQETIQHSIDQDEPQTVTAQSVGINQDGETVARFDITWSFKLKN